MRKLYIVLSLLVFASMVLTACGGEPATPAPQPTQAPTNYPTPVGDLYLSFREDYFPAVEGQMQEPVLWVTLPPGKFGQDVSATLILEDGTEYLLEPNPQETPLRGLIGGSQLKDSKIESSSGAKYKYGGMFDFSIYYTQEE